jgi:hypothetical protein
MPRALTVCTVTGDITPDDIERLNANRVGGDEPRKTLSRLALPNHEDWQA